MRKQWILPFFHSWDDSKGICFFVAAVARIVVVSAVKYASVLAEMRLVCGTACIELFY
jgi:hypothetical protein